MRYFQETEAEVRVASDESVQNFFPGLVITGATLGVVALGLFSRWLFFYSSQYILSE